MRRDRIMVTVSPAMLVALTLQAERSGLTIATQAMVVLRQGLDRTIQSEEGMRRLAAYTAFQNAATWREGLAADREVQLGLEAATAAKEGAQDAC